MFREQDQNSKQLPDKVEKHRVATNGRRVDDMKVLLIATKAVCKSDAVLLV